MQACVNRTYYDLLADLPENIRQAADGLWIVINLKSLALTQCSRLTLVS